MEFPHPSLLTPRPSLQIRCFSATSLSLYLFLLLSLLLSFSCYYSFREEVSGGKRLYIKPFTNITAEPDIHELLMRELSKELAGVFRLSSLGDADYQLEGELTEVKEVAYTYTPQEEPREFRVTIKGQFRVSRRGEILLTQQELQGFGIYPVEGGKRGDAINSAIGMLKDKLADLLRTL